MLVGADYRSRSVISLVQAAFSDAQIADVLAPPDREIAIARELLESCAHADMLAEQELELEHEFEAEPLSFEDACQAHLNDLRANHSGMWPSVGLRSGIPVRILPTASSGSGSPAAMCADVAPGRL
ncbi:MAG: hypothetical protein JO366_07480 [Methylobacteriaceae bacterium]|nr:hypothetical protein [Methylobacteriaceae bacterium]MBV9244636.1 hypothetical protein [Methylobacteriaceae bacterium]MBV9635965.1 hypothetical protein [Methylobacteriaceae bacterium]